VAAVKIIAIGVRTIIQVVTFRPANPINAVAVCCRRIATHWVVRTRAVTQASVWRRIGDIGTVQDLVSVILDKLQPVTVIIILDLALRI
jgi:hypothetical protein